MINGVTVTVPCSTCEAPVPGVYAIFAAQYPVNCDPCIAAAEALRAQREAANDDTARRAAARVVERHNPAPPRYAQASLATAIRDADNERAIDIAQRFAAAVIRSGTGVGIDGIGFYSPAYGTGKTHIAWGIVNDLRAAGYGAMLYTVGGMLAAIKDTFGDDSRGEWLARTLRTVPVLVLDDFGKEFAREESWSAMEVFEVARDRYDRMLPTVFTTNYEPSALLTRSSSNDKERAIIDRNLSITWLQCGGRTRRVVNASWM